MVQLQLVYKLKLELQEYSKSKGRGRTRGGARFLHTEGQSVFVSRSGKLKVIWEIN